MLSTYIQVENPQARAMVKKVICVSILMMIVVIIQSIIAFADSSSIIANINNGGGGIGNSSSGPTIHGGFQQTFVTIISPLISLAFALLIPLCGICGAKNRNKPLLCLFCGCNCFMAFLSVLALVVLVLTHALFTYVKSVCDSGGEMPGGSQYSCTDFFRYFSYDKIEGYIWLAFAFGLVSFILQCLGCIWGLSLYNNYEQYFEVVVAGNVAYQPVVAQPAGQGGYYQPPQYATQAQPQMQQQPPPMYQAPQQAMPVGGQGQIPSATVVKTQVGNGPYQPV